MFFFFNQKYCSRTQVASPPTPLRKERGVITVIPLVVRRYFHTLLLKQTVSYTPPLCRRGGRGGEAKGVKCVIPLVVRRYFHLLLLKRTVSCTPPLCRRGGWGVRLFFICKREDVKSSFTSSLFTYILFLVPLLTTPHYVHIHKDIVVSAPLPAWEGSGKSLLGDLLFTVQCRLVGCCTSQTFLVCFQHFHFQQLVN